MNTPLAVTGSTGRVGGSVARLLAAGHVPLRLPVRDLNRAPQLPNAVAVQFSYTDRPAATRALDGVETLFMVSAEEAQDRVAQHCSFIDAAQAAGVRHVVYTSFVGADPDATFTLARDHWATEEYLRRSGMSYTFLRNNLYLDVLPYFADDDGALRGPAGTGRLAAVAREDVAQVAALILRSPSQHVGATYDLTGPVALSLEEAATIISSATGRAIHYLPETVEEAYASRRRFGAADWQLDAWVSTYTAIAAGDLQHTTSAVSDLLGRPPLGLADVLQSHR